MKNLHIPTWQAGTGVRPGRPLVWPIAGALLLWWCHLVLGPNLPALLGGVAVLLVGVWTVRRRRPVAVCVAIAAGTAAGFATACMVVVDRQVPGAADMVGVLTGYLLAAPVPAMVACLLRPAGLVSAPRGALLGSGILLLAAAPTVLVPAWGLSDVVLVTALAAAVAVIYRRHRRASSTLTGPLPTLHGWTDLGGRRTPDGTRIDRLLLGAGHAVVCTHLGHRPVTDRTALTAVHRASAAAQAVGLTPHRVQPVILTTTGKDTVTRHLVDDGDVAAAVIIAEPDQLDQIIAQAPHRRPGQRRAVLAAALLHTIPTLAQGRVE